MQPTLRALFKAESVTHDRIKKILASATGKAYSGSYIAQCCGGNRKWPDNAAPFLYQHLKVIGVRITRKQFDKLFNQTRLEILGAEALYERKKLSS